jgi:phospholipid/cholesterol/gamma-HCH transport system substrate-binding protein
MLLEIAGGVERFKRGHRFHAQFKNVYELKAGDPVKMAGVQVGRVETLELTNQSVLVTFKLKPEVLVRTDTKAAIRFASMLGGQNFIALDFGTEKGLKAEPNTILTSVDQPDVNALLAKLDNVATGVENVTRSFSGDRIDNLLGPFTDFMKQNNTKLTAIFGNMQIISDNIASGRGTLGRIVKDDELYTTALGTVSNFQSTATEIQQAVAEARQMLRRSDGMVDNLNRILTNANEVVLQINSGKGTLGRLTRDERLYSESTTAMTNLREIFEKINRGQGSVGKLVNDESLFKNVKLTLQKVDKATEGLEDQGPISLMGTVLGSLF